MIKPRSKVINSDEDTGTEIARCALYVAETGRRVNVVEDDTDVALLLLYHRKCGMANVKFTSEKSKATFDISSSLLEMPAKHQTICSGFACMDWLCTTSAIHSKEKNSLTKKLKTSQHL